ncbi:MAG: glycosyltransferase family 4 protein [Alphaproteobacteria bacterium]
MKILFHHRIASRDGQWVHMTALIEALTAQGHQVVMVGPAPLSTMAFGGESRLVAALKRTIPRAVYEVLELAYNMIAFLRLRRACLLVRPDVIYERYNLFLLAGVAVSRLHRLPLLLEVNAPIREERARHGGLSLTGLAAWCQRTIWRGADVVLPVTGVLAGHVRDAGVAEDRIVVIPNGIDPARYAVVPSREAARERLGLGLGRRLVLGFTGFVRDWHGLERVVDLLAQSGEALDLHLLVVGDGPARGDLEARARRLGVAHRLTVTGIVGPEWVPVHIAAFDIALQPGVTPYASPLKLFEYMAVGRPVVAPDTANIREILTDGDNALLFDPARPETMTAAILRMCSDRTLRDHLATRARATIERRGLTWPDNARRVVQLARQAVARGAKQEHPAHWTGLPRRR